jgi:hypothetical protein
MPSRSRELPASRNACGRAVAAALDRSRCAQVGNVPGFMRLPNESAQDHVSKGLARLRMSHGGHYSAPVRWIKFPRYASGRRPSFLFARLFSLSLTLTLRQVAARAF